MMERLFTSFNTFVHYMLFHREWNVCSFVIISDDDVLGADSEKMLKTANM